MIFALKTDKNKEKIMADSKSTKARIKEIRNRVFNEPVEKILVDDTKDVAFEQDTHPSKSEPLTLKTEDLVVKEFQSDRIKTENFIKTEDFISFKNQLNDDIKDYFEALDVKITGSLNSFAADIPDIKKGSTVREQLDNEIGDIISQRMIQQSRSLNRAVEDLRGRFRGINDLDELKTELEGILADGISSSSNATEELRKNLTAGLAENSDKLEESNSANRKYFSSFIDNFTTAKDEIDTQIKQSNDKITAVRSDTQNLMSEAALDLENKNNALEASLTQKLEGSYDKSMSKLKQLDDVVSDSILSSSKALEVVKRDLELGLVESYEKFEDFYGSIKEDFTFEKNAIDMKIKQNDDKVTAFSFDIRNKIAKATLGFEMKNNILQDKLTQQSQNVSKRLNILESEIKTDLNKLRSAIKRKPN